MLNGDFFYENYSQGTATKALGGPVMVNGVILGTEQSYKGPPLSTVSLFLGGMSRNS